MIFTSEALLAAVFSLPRLTVVRPVCAYIDPGTGSLVLQIILGSALAFLVAIKLYWRQLKGFAGRLIRRRSGDREAHSPEKTEAETERREGDSGA